MSRPRLSIAEHIRITNEFCQSMAAATTRADQRAALIDAWREQGYTAEEIEQMLGALP